MTVTMSGRPGIRRLVVIGIAAAVALPSVVACWRTDAPRSASSVAPAPQPGPQAMAEQPATAPLVEPTGAAQPLQPSGAVAVEQTVPDPVPATPSSVPGSPTAAPTTVPGSDDGRAVQRLDDPAAVHTSSAALGLLRIDWRTLLPGWQVRFLPGRAGLRGATFPDRDIIEIYVRASDRPPELAHVVAHELGHAVDVSRFREVDRRTWKEARGIASGAAWFAAGSAVPDFATPAGDWAESFAYWLVGSGWYSQLGPPPNAAQTAVIARMAGIG